jgi:hypothetical protein
VSVYKIVLADQVQLDNPAVVYREHGIALVAAPANP